MSSSQSRISELRSLTRTSSVKEISSKFKGKSVVETQEAHHQKMRKMSQSDRAMWKVMRKYNLGGVDPSQLSDALSPASVQTAQGLVAQRILNLSPQEKLDILQAWSKSMALEKPGYSFTSDDAVTALGLHGINITEMEESSQKEWQEVIQEVLEEQAKLLQDTERDTNTSAGSSRHHSMGRFDSCDFHEVILGQLQDQNVLLDESAVTGIAEVSFDLSPDKASHKGHINTNITTTEQEQQIPSTMSLADKKKLFENPTAPATQATAARSLNLAPLSNSSYRSTDTTDTTDYLPWMRAGPSVDTHDDYGSIQPVHLDLDNCELFPSGKTVFPQLTDHYEASDDENEDKDEEEVAPFINEVDSPESDGKMTVLDLVEFASSRKSSRPSMEPSTTTTATITVSSITMNAGACEVREAMSIEAESVDDVQLPPIVGVVVATVDSASLVTSTDTKPVVLTLQSSSIHHDQSDADSLHESLSQPELTSPTRSDTTDIAPTATIAVDNKLPSVAHMTELATAPEVTPEFQVQSPPEDSKSKLIANTAVKLTFSTNKAKLPATTGLKKEEIKKAQFSLLTMIGSIVFVVSLAVAVAVYSGLFAPLATDSNKQVLVAPLSNIAMQEEIVVNSLFSAALPTQKQQVKKEQSIVEKPVTIASAALEKKREVTSESITIVKPVDIVDVNYPQAEAEVDTVGILAVKTTELTHITTTITTTKAIIDDIITPLEDDHDSHSVETIEQEAALAVIPTCKTNTPSSPIPADEKAQLVTQKHAKQWFMPWRNLLKNFGETVAKFFSKIIPGRKTHV